MAGNEWAIKWGKQEMAEKTQTRPILHGWKKWGRVWLTKTCQQKEMPMLANTRFWKRWTERGQKKKKNHSSQMDFIWGHQVGK